MVAEAQRERDRFKKALNGRVAREHHGERGRAQWLYGRIKTYAKAAGVKPVSAQTCGYWLRGEKIAKHQNATLLTAALGMTRGELFGESGDPRLAEIVESWDALPENLKVAMHAMANPSTSTADAQQREPRPRSQRASTRTRMAR